MWIYAYPAIKNGKMRKKEQREESCQFLNKQEWIEFSKEANEKGLFIDE